MELFRVLKGLPGTGPMYVPFKVTKSGGYSEGYVVEFFPDSPESWVGNFQKGSCNHSEVVLHPNGSDVIVVAHGQGYIVDPRSRALKQTLGCQIDGAIAVPTLELVVLQGLVDLEIHRKTGMPWRTPRIGWDGFRSIQVKDGILHGEAWHYDDEWRPFTLDLRKEPSSENLVQPDLAKIPYEGSHQEQSDRLSDAWEMSSIIAIITFFFGIGPIWSILDDRARGIVAAYPAAAVVISACLMLGSIGLFLRINLARLFLAGVQIIVAIAALGLLAAQQSGMRRVEPWWKFAIGALVFGLFASSLVAPSSKRLCSRWGVLARWFRKKGK